MRSKGGSERSANMQQLDRTGERDPLLANCTPCGTVSRPCTRFGSLLTGRAVKQDVTEFAGHQLGLGRNSKLTPGKRFRAIPFHRRRSLHLCKENCFSIAVRVSSGLPAFACFSERVIMSVRGPASGGWQRGLGAGISIHRREYSFADQSSPRLTSKLASWLPAAVLD